MPSPQRRGNGGNSDMDTIDQSELINDLHLCARRLDFLTNHARARLLADNDYETLSTRFSFSLGMVLAHHSEAHRSQPVQPETLRNLIDGCDAELSSWERHILPRHNKTRRRPGGDMPAAEYAFRGLMVMIDRYLDGLDPADPAHTIARAIERMERLMSHYPRDAEYQHGLAHAVSGLEQAKAAAEFRTASPSSQSPSCLTPVQSGAAAR